MGTTCPRSHLRRQTRVRDPRVPQQRHRQTNLINHTLEESTRSARSSPAPLDVKGTRRLRASTRTWRRGGGEGGAATAARRAVGSLCGAEYNRSDGSEALALFPRSSCRPVTHIPLRSTWRGKSCCNDYHKGLDSVVIDKGRLDGGYAKGDWPWPTDHMAMAVKRRFHEINWNEEEKNTAPHIEDFRVESRRRIRLRRRGEQRLPGRPSAASTTWSWASRNAQCGQRRLQGFSACDMSDILRNLLWRVQTSGSISAASAIGKVMREDSRRIVKKLRASEAKYVGAHSRSWLGTVTSGEPGRGHDIAAHLDRTAYPQLRLHQAACHGVLHELVRPEPLRSSGAGSRYVSEHSDGQGLHVRPRRGHARPPARPPARPRRRIRARHDPTSVDPTAETTRQRQDLPRTGRMCPTAGVRPAFAPWTRL